MPNAKKKREPSFEENVVVNIEGLHNRINNTRSILIKLIKRDSVLNSETKKEDVDFIFLKKDMSETEASICDCVIVQT